MVGLFTFMSIGAAVLYDLWEILDVKKGHTMVSSSISGSPKADQAGLLQSAFRLSSHWTYRCSILPLPSLLLDTLQGPHLLWAWRYLHVACLPGDSARKRTAPQLAR